MVCIQSNLPDVAFILGGYPTPKNPRRQLFSHRSIKALSQYLNPLVIHMRFLTPSRPVLEFRKWEGINVVSVSIPQIPIETAQRLNLLLRCKIGFYLLKEILQPATIFHSAAVFPTGYVASHWAKILDKPHISQAIGSDVHIHLRNSASTLTNDWISGIHGVVCNSQAIREDLQAFIPNLANVEVIYRGVDTDFFSPHGEAKGPLSVLSPVRFLFLGGFQTWDKRLRDHNYKGGHILLDAWKKAAPRLRTSSILITGPGTNRSELEKWKASLPDPTKVYIQDELHPDQVPMYIRSSDVVVIPSLDEGLPNVANEAQACGRPVLGTDAGGIPETVIHQHTGLIVPRGDVDALANGLLWYEEHINTIPILGKNAREHILNNFSWDIYSKKMIDFYQLASHYHQSEKRKTKSENS